MKTTIFIIFCVFAPLSISAQSFAPIGAKWYYTNHFAWGDEISYVSIESVKDTIVKGRNCRKLENHDFFACLSIPGHKNYVYEMDSVVYFYEAAGDTFQVLYNLKARTGDTWKMIYGASEFYPHLDSTLVIVDSTGTITINDHDLKVLYVRYKVNEIMASEIYSGFSTRIIEKIGDISYLFNFYNSSTGSCDINYSAGLRCYEDSEIGLYSTGIAPSCDYIFEYSSLPEYEPHKNLFSFHPNPVLNELIITSLRQTSGKYDVINNLGQLLQSGFLKGTETRLDLSNQKPGIFLIRITINDQSVLYKRLIKL